MRVAPRLEKYLRDWRTFPADAALAYRLDGVRGIWEELAPRTLDRFIGSGHVVVFAQPLDSARDIPAPEGVTVRPIHEADWPALSTMVTQRTISRFRLLVAGGRHGIVAWRGPRPIGYGWVAERLGPDVTACPLALPSHAAYLWDLYVVPEERSNGVGSALASARVRKARELGFREGWRMISPSNAPSLRTLAKSGSGSRVVGELRYIKVLTHVHARFAPAAVSGEFI